MCRREREEKGKKESLTEGDEFASGNGIIVKEKEGKIRALLALKREREREDISWVQEISKWFQDEEESILRASRTDDELALSSCLIAHYITQRPEALGQWEWISVPSRKRSARESSRANEATLRGGFAAFRREIERESSLIPSSFSENNKTEREAKREPQDDKTKQ